MPILPVVIFEWCLVTKTSPTPTEETDNKIPSILNNNEYKVNLLKRNFQTIWPFCLRNLSVQPCNYRITKCIWPWTWWFESDSLHNESKRLVSNLSTMTKAIYLNRVYTLGDLLFLTNILGNMFLSFFKKYLYVIFKTYINFARSYILASLDWTTFYYIKMAGK